MNGLNFSLHAASFCVAVSLLCACGDSQSPIAAPAAISQRAAAAARDDRGKSWMLPEARSEDLLYVSNDRTNDVYVYRYPTRHLVGVLTGFDDPKGECVDTAADVYVTNDGGVLEYAHGGKRPLRKLKDSGSDCSVDPITGNLAVVLQRGVSIYESAHGAPKYYPYKSPYGSADTLNCAYDDRGNLFVDAEIEESPSANDSFAVGELEKNGTTLRTVWYPEGSENPNDVPGGLAWDGKHIAAGDRRSGTVYILIHPSGRELTLNKSFNVMQFWIQGGTLIGPNYDGENVMFWNYPAGGNPSKTLRGLGLFSYGATVSLDK